MQIRSSIFSGLSLGLVWAFGGPGTAKIIEKSKFSRGFDLEASNLIETSVKMIEISVTSREAVIADDPVVSGNINSFLKCKKIFYWFSACSSIQRLTSFMYHDILHDFL